MTTRTYGILDGNIYVLVTITFAAKVLCFISPERNAKTGHLRIMKKKSFYFETGFVEKALVQTSVTLSLIPVVIIFTTSKAVLQSKLHIINT